MKPKYGKSIVDIPVTVKLRKRKSFTATPNEMQDELNRLYNERVDAINFSVNRIIAKAEGQ